MLTVADPTYLPGYAATVHINLRVGNTNELKHVVLGQFGVLHPSVLKNFELSYVP